MKLDHTIRIGGSKGRGIRVDAQLARRIDEYGAHLGEQLGVKVSRSFAATILVLTTPDDSYVSRTRDASQPAIRTAIRAALDESAHTRKAHKRPIIIDTTA